MIRLEKKTLVVSSWAPPMLGASPHFLYTLFSNFEPSSYGIFTDRGASNENLAHPRLLGQYYYFDTQPTDKFLAVRTFKKICLFLRAVRDGLQIIRSERYTLLLGTADKGEGLFLVFVLSLLSRTPYALYFLDPYRWNNLGAVRNVVATVFEPMLFKYSRQNFLAGSGLAPFYKKKYGSNFHYVTIQNCPEQPAARSMSPNKNDRYTIIYSGGVYWPQERALRNLIQAVTSIDVPIQAILYTPRHLTRFEKEFEHNDRVVFRSAPQSAMANIQDDADILFLPLSFNTPAPAVIETATPGKTAEYLLAGRPILVHAPPYAFIARYAREKGFAHVVDTEEIAELQDGIRKIMRDHEYATSLITQAQTVFKEEYNLRENAQRFADGVASA